MILTESKLKLPQITAAMQKWKDARNSAGLTQMTAWLNQGNVFSYARDINNVPVYPDQKAYVHAYPGIVTEAGVDTLYFMVVSGYLDVSSNMNIAENTHCYRIDNGQPSRTSTGGMPIAEALQRIQDWEDHHNQWIGQNISTANSIFQAFVIPQDDSAVGLTHNAFLALVANSAAPGGYTPDLIIEDIDGSSIIYADTVEFIPPMGGVDTPLSPTRFYLLSLLT